MSETPDGAFTCADDPGEPGYAPGVGRISITRDDARVLSAMAAGCRVLEIGTGLGISTRALAELAKVVQTIDSDPWIWTNVWPGLRAEGVACGWPGNEWEGEFDLAFIDGRHTKEQTAEDVNGCIKCLRPGGTLLVHDAKAGDVVEGAKAAGIGFHEIIDTKFGIGIWRKPQEA